MIYQRLNILNVIHIKTCSILCQSNQRFLLPLVVCGWFLRMIQFFASSCFQHEKLNPESGGGGGGVGTDWGSHTFSLLLQSVSTVEGGRRLTYLVVLWWQFLTLHRRQTFQNVSIPSPPPPPISYPKRCNTSWEALLLRTTAGNVRHCLEDCSYRQNALHLTNFYVPRSWSSWKGGMREGKMELLWNVASKGAFQPATPKLYRRTGESCIRGSAWKVHLSAAPVRSPSFPNCQLNIWIAILQPSWDS